MRSLARVLASSLLALSFVSCAGDVDTIDRTQPGKLRKSALAGEWYFRQTIVDVPYTTGVTFVGEQSLLERMRFEISEDFLTAYRTYERVQGAEVPSELPGQTYQGAPVAAFRILKHFDVSRVYAAETGEQTNVLEENDYDRPWYDREYVRVDWSQNLLANFDFLAGGEEGLGVLAQSASYVVTDPKSPDAPVFGQRDGDGWRDYRDPVQWGNLASVDYFDVTLKLQVSPESFELWFDDGTTEQWPACWFYDLGPWDCASQTIKVRASFLKVQPSNYEPMYYPDNYVARDDDGEAVRLYVGDDENHDARCTRDEPNETCYTVRIPMFDWFGYFRTEREAYDQDYGLTEEGRVYLINRFNLWQRTHDADGKRIPERNREAKKIVYYLAENFPEELMPAAEEVGAWWNEAFHATVQGLNASGDEIFQVKKNTYRASGGEIEDFGQRNGDLRYNHLYWVDAPQLESLLGYGPSAADPLTGEIIAADAYVYGAAIDEYATWGADIVDLLRGDILEHEFIDGENVGRAVAALLRVPGGDAQGMRQKAADMMAGRPGERLRHVRERGPNGFQRGYDWAASRLRLADNDPRFDGLWNHELSRTLEQRFGRKLQPSELGARRLVKALKRHRMQLAKRGVDLGFGDQGLLGLVDRVKDLPRAEVIATLRADIFKSTAAHEVGHTVGLRHNFAGSTDALNYMDGYWAMRDPAAQALDLPTDEEAQAGLRELSYSSIMDYGAKFVSDIRGIGKYDRAAVKFGYGQLVEQFVNPPLYPDDDNPNRHPLLAAFYLDDIVQNWSHYTDLPTLFSNDGSRADGLTNIRERQDVPMREVIGSLTWDPDYDDLSDTLVPYKFCSDEYVGAAWDCDVWDEGADPYEIVNFAAQSWRDYYIFSAFKRNQRYLDPIDYYYATASRTMMPMASQYQLWLYDQWYQGGEWAYIHEVFQGDDTVVTNPDWNLDPHGGLTRTAAAMTAMNFLAEVVALPEPGSYYTDPDEPNTMYWYGNWQDPICADGENSFDDLCADVYVPLGTGRYAYSEFADESGYYWYERVRVIGSFWDKLAAIETLADPTTYFLGVDDVANVTQYILGFNVVFPHAVGSLFGSVVNDDYRYFAPTVDPDGNLVRAPLFDSLEVAYGDTVPETLTARPGPFVDPATNWTVSLYTLYYGMALLNANFDQTFNDFAKIWVDGSAEQWNPDPTLLAVQFENPFNGRTYKAVKSPDAKAYSMGYEMVSRANTLAAAAGPCVDDPSGAGCSNKLWPLQNLIENMEIVRGYYDIFGYAWW